MLHTKLQRFIAWMTMAAMLVTCAPFSALADVVRASSGAQQPFARAILQPEDDKNVYVTIKYMIEYDDDDNKPDELYSTQIVRVGDVLQSPPTPTPYENRKFMGWYLRDADGNNATRLQFGRRFEGYAEDTEIEAYALFGKVCYVYFMRAEGDGGGVLATAEVPEGGTVSKDAWAKVNAYEPNNAYVIGWKVKDEDGSARGDFTDASTVNQNLTVVPVTEACKWVTFNTMGGSSVESVHIKKADDIHLSLAGKSPSRLGYTFKGWSLVRPDDENKLPDDNQIYTENDTLEIKDSCTLYAIWEPVEVPYTIMYWIEMADSEDYSVLLLKPAKALTGTTVNSNSALGLTKDDFAELDYFTRNEEMNLPTVIAPDGSSVLNVYYDRNEYTINFYYAKKVNNQYRIPVSNGYDFDGDNDFKGNNLSLSNRYGIVLSEFKPSAGGMNDGTYWYFTLKAKYGQNISAQWPQAPEQGSVELYKSNTKIKQEPCRFVSWGVDHASPYGQTHTNRNIKGIYPVMSAELIMDAKDPSKPHKMTAYYAGRFKPAMPFDYVPFFQNLDETEDVEGKTESVISTATYKEQNPLSYAGFDVDSDRTAYYKRDSSGKITEIKKTNSVPTGNETGIVHFYYKRLSYTLTFKDGQDEKKAQSIKYEDTLADKGGVEGYAIGQKNDKGEVFQGWFTQNTDVLNGLTEAEREAYRFNFHRTMPAHNLVAYAYWAKPTVQVTINVHIDGKENFVYTTHVGSTIAGSSQYQQAVKVIREYVSTETSPKENIMFSRWQDEYGKPFDINSEIAKDTVIHATYSGSKTYTVTYKADENVTDGYRYPMPFMSGASARALTLEEAKERNGFGTPPVPAHFVCWRDQNRQRYYPGEQIGVYADMVLVAEYGTETKPTLIYCSNYDGATPAQASETIELNNQRVTIQTYEATGLPARAGYRFKGWNTAADGSGTSFAPSSEARVNTTGENHLYAQWEKLYTVTYQKGDHGKLAGQDDNGNVSTPNLERGASTPAAPAVTADDGYYFTGWMPIISPNVWRDAVYVAQYAEKTRLTLTVANQTVAYNGQEQQGYAVPNRLSASAGDYTLVGLKDGHTLEVLYTPAKGTNVSEAPYQGSFAPSWKVLDDDGEDVTEQYSASFVFGTLTVKPREVTLTSASASKTYDGEPLKKEEVNVTNGSFADGEGVETYNVTGNRTEVGASKNTFDYTLKTNTKADNYTITKVEGTLEVTPLAKEIVIRANSASKTYDGTPLTDNGYAYTGELALGDRLIAVVTGSQTDAGESVNEVVSYKVMRGTTDVTDHYTNIRVVFGTLTVSKRPVTITAAAADKRWGEADPAFKDAQMSGHVAGELGKISLKVRRTNPTAEAVGVYPKVLTIGDTAEKLNEAYPNYAFTVIPADFTIKTSNALKVSAQNVALMYDGDAHGVTAAANIAGAVIRYMDEKGKYTLEESPRWTHVTDDAMTVRFQATLTGYEPAYGTATVTIRKRPVTITAAEASKLYGEPDPAFGNAALAISKEGLTDAQRANLRKELASVALAVRRTNPTAEAVGEYPGVLSIRNTKAELNAAYQDYTFTVRPAKFAILPSGRLTVSADDVLKMYDARSYGVTATASVPDATIRYMDENGEYTLTSGPKWTHVTNGAMTVRFQATLEGYQPAEGVATVTITPRPVTVWANDKLKREGEADPTLDARVTGVLPGDEDKLHYTLSREPGERVGAYAIMPAGDAAQGDYAVGYQRGTLRITGVCVTIHYVYEGNASLDRTETMPANWNDVVLDIGSRVLANAVEGYQVRSVSGLPLVVSEDNEANHIWVYYAPRPTPPAQNPDQPKRSGLVTLFDLETPTGAGLGGINVGDCCE